MEIRNEVRVGPVSDVRLSNGSHLCGSPASTYSLDLTGPVDGSTALTRHCSWDIHVVLVIKVASSEELENLQVEVAND